MQICITSTGSKLDSSVDQRFGRAQCFLLLDKQGKLKEALPNEGVAAMRGAGIAAAQTIASKGVEVLITGNIGPNAFAVLQQTGIKIFLVPPGTTVKDAFSEWKKNKLTQVEQATVPGYFGRGGGSNRGGGFGRGRGRP